VSMCTYQEAQYALVLRHAGSEGNGLGARAINQPKDPSMTETLVSPQELSNQRNASRKDDPLVRAAAEGDEAAFEALVRIHRRRILRVVLRITGRLEDAEDITQQTFLKAFLNLRSFGGRCAVSTWLVRIAINETFMWKRRSKGVREVGWIDMSQGWESGAVPEIADKRMNQESAYLQQEQRRLLLSAIESLSPASRVTLRMCDLEGRSVIDCARRLGMSATAVKSRRSRGREILRDHVRRQLSVPPAHRKDQGSFA